MSSTEIPSELAGDTHQIRFEDAMADVERFSDELLFIRDAHVLSRLVEGGHLPVTEARAIYETRVRELKPLYQPRRLIAVSTG